jgi:hypothetical protein
MLSVLALVLTACGPLGSSSAAGDTATPSVTPTPTPSPAEVLAAAVTKTTGVSLKLKLADTASESLTGSYDAVHHIGTIGEAGDLHVTVTGDDIYLSGMSELEGQTLRLKISKLRAASPLNLFANVVAALDLLPAATSVETTDTHKFSGQLDLTKAHGATPGGKKFLAYVTSGSASRSTSVPFTATINDAGYLVEFDATFPNLDSGKDGEYDVTFSDIAKPVTNTVPTGPNVLDAPASVYATT